MFAIVLKCFCPVFHFLSLICHCFSFQLLHNVFFLPIWPISFNLGTHYTEGLFWPSQCCWQGSTFLSKCIWIRAWLKFSFSKILERISFTFFAQHWEKNSEHGGNSHSQKFSWELASFSRSTLRFSILNTEKWFSNFRSHL